MSTDVSVTLEKRAYQNENIPVTIDPDDFGIYDIPSLTGWWTNDHNTMKGIIKPVTFEWTGRTKSNPRSLLPARSNYAPRPLTDTRDFLAFGYGGSLTDANNGNLWSPAGVSFLDYQVAVTWWGVVRIPASGGGAIIGAVLNQTDAFNNAANNRWHGLQVGFSATPGKPRFCYHGDASWAQPSTAIDLRDNNIHLLVGGWDNASQVATLRIDGVTVGTFATLGTQLNPTQGTQEVRVGATGLRTDTVGTNTLVGDLFEGGVNNANLCNAALATDLATLESRILAKYEIA